MGGTSGKTGKAVINGSTLCATEWSLNYEQRLRSTRTNMWRLTQTPWLMSLCPMTM